MSGAARSTRSPVAAVRALAVLGGLGGLAALPTPAHAQRLPGPVAAGAIGRAGVQVVSVEDPSALWLAPAGLGRQGAQLALGVVWVDTRATFASAERFGAVVPAAATSTAPARAVPSGGASWPLGERTVVGLGWHEDAPLALSWPRPAASFDPARDDRAATPGRYAALATTITRKGLAGGGAVRIGETLAVGASVLLEHAAVELARTVWGGLGAVDRIPELSPAFDVPLATSLTGLAPGAALSILWAPEDAPLELAAAVVWRGAVSLSGPLELGRSRGSGNDGPLVRGVGDDPRAESTLDAELTVRGGARFIATRWALEADAELTRGGALADPTLTRATLEHTSGARADLATLPLGVTQRDHVAFGVAGELDVVPGFLLVTAGYRYDGARVDRASQSPALLGLAGHTAAVGLAASAGDVTIDFGVALRFGVRSDVDPGQARVLTPLATGDVPAARGTLDGRTVFIGVQARTAL